MNYRERMEDTVSRDSKGGAAEYRRDGWLRQSKSWKKPGKQTTVLGALMELSILQCKTGEAGPCASAIGRWGRVCMRFMGCRQRLSASHFIR